MQRVSSMGTEPHPRGWMVPGFNSPTRPNPPLRRRGIAADGDLAGRRDPPTLTNLAPVAAWGSARERSRDDCAPCCATMTEGRNDTHAKPRSHLPGRGRKTHHPRRPRTPTCRGRDLHRRRGKLRRDHQGSAHTARPEGDNRVRTAIADRPRDRQAPGFKPPARTTHPTRGTTREGAHTIPLHIITGPPAAGKSTYIREHRQPGDITVDYDDLANTLAAADPDNHDHPDTVKGVAQAARRAAISEAMKTPDTTVWIIDSKPNRQNLTRYKQAGAEIHVIDPGIDEVLRRCRGRTARAHRSRRTRMVRARQAEDSSTTRLRPSTPTSPQTSHDATKGRTRVRMVRTINVPEARAELRRRSTRSRPHQGSEAPRTRGRRPTTPPHLQPQQGRRKRPPQTRNKRGTRPAPRSDIHLGIAGRPQHVDKNRTHTPRYS